MTEFFLAPTFLWGILAASLPILIHLLARRRFKRVSWAAMEFLRRALQKTQRRMRIENLLLLVLRTAAVALLALALARPVLTQVPVLAGFGEEERTVFLAVDTSMSMGVRSGPRGAETAMDRAKALAGEILSGLKARDEVYLLWVSDRLDAPFDLPTPEKRRAREEVMAVEAGDGGTRWEPALRHLAEVLARPEVKQRPSRQVFCISDMQATGWLGGASAPAAAPAAPGEGGEPARAGEGAAGPAEPAGSPPTERRPRPHHDALASVARLAGEVVLLDVSSGERENLAVTEVSTGDRVVGVGAPVRIQATIANFGTARADPVTVRLLVQGPGEASLSPQGTAKIAVDPRGKATADFHHTFVPPRERDRDREASYRVQVELVEAEDALARDNRRELAVHARDLIRVLLVDGNPLESDPVEHEAHHLRYQLFPAKDADSDDPSVPSLIRPTVRDMTDLGSVAFGDYDLVLLANDGEGCLRPEVRSALDAYLRDGGALLVIPGSRVSPEDYTRLLFREPRRPDGTAGILPAPLGAPVRVEGEALRIAPADWQHPIFRDLSDPAWRLMMTKPSVRRHFTVPGALAPGARVLARLSDPAETPALVERRVGEGRVLLLTTGWAKSWGALFVRETGLMLLNEIVLYLAREKAEGRNVPLGAPLRWVIHESQYAENVWVVTPRGGSPHLDSPRKIREGWYAVEVRETREAGFHEIHLKRESGKEVVEETALFAATLDPIEGDLTIVPAADLLSAIPADLRKKVRVARAVRASAPLETSPASEVSRPLLGLALLLLLGESLLARRLSRRGE
ncbi:MAG: BatA domain-containing protein [Planctomycetales bacterium]|nr:BatA domain-containing protein [Planctomycetales bacterium]